MNCNDAEALVARYADGEIDGQRGSLLEVHLQGCARCAAKHEDILALRARIRAEVPYFQASPAARARVLAMRRSRACCTTIPAASRDRPMALAHRRCTRRLHRHRARVGARHRGHRPARER